MSDQTRNHASPGNGHRPPRVKVVAEIPGDDRMREQMKERKKRDGHPDSCGGL